MLERVQKIMAAAGIASRRKCEDLIRAGKVSINNKTAILGDKADPKKDIIKVNNKPINIEEKVYIIFNKPRGCVTTLSDPQGRKTVMDYIRIKKRIFPVGRLDKDTEGLLILTNDGELANRIMHPRYEIAKTYYVVLAHPISKEQVKRLKRGIIIDNRKADIERIKLIGPCSLELDIHEGRKHIVRKIFAKLHLPINRLVRTRVGPVVLRDIKPGKFKQFSKNMLIALKKEIKLN